MAAGAAVWGLFWIPLRTIEQTGLSGLTVVAIANATAALLVLGIMLASRKRHQALPLRALLQPSTLLLGSALGVSSVLYMLALLYTDVIRAVFLFYLLPVWAMLAARVLYAEPVTPRQIMAVVLTVIGVWLLLGGDTEHLSVNPGFGDSLAIAAGMTWGLGLALLGDKGSPSPTASACATFSIATLLAIAVLFATSLLSGSSLATIEVSVQATPLPDGLSSSSTTAGVFYAMAFGLLLLLPSVLGQIWGADRLPATLAAILTTTEILVATISAIVLVGTSVDSSGALGAVLIGVAFWQAMHTRAR